MLVFLPQGTISVGVDATDLFDRYDEEYEDVSGSGFPQIEINKMHISQSIEVKHTDPFHVQPGPELMRRSAGAAGWESAQGFSSSLSMKARN